MPVTAARKKLYPANWLELRAAVLERARFGGEIAHCDRSVRCELCGLPNHVYVSRHKDVPVWTTLTTPQAYESNPQTRGMYGRPVRIVLTVHHINNDQTDNRMCNLIALCQRCHNKLDAPYRALKARQTRAEGRNRG